jgi:hypothetical protein
MEYYHNHDGWEDKWPLTFLFFRDALKQDPLGEYKIELEFEPSFWATKQ